MVCVGKMGVQTASDTLIQNTPGGQSQAQDSYHSFSIAAPHAQQKHVLHDPHNNRVFS